MDIEWVQEFTSDNMLYNNNSDIEINKFLGENNALYYDY